MRRRGQGWTRSVLWALALGFAPLASAEEPAPWGGETVDPDQPAADAPDDSLWELVDQVDGEPPTAEESQAFAEQTEQHFSELALVEELGGGVDVPLDWYADPAAVLHVDPLHLDELNPHEFDIPVVVNSQVIKWMRYFLGPGRKYYSRWLDRAEVYRPLMREELEKASLPQDLVYLSMIESGYNAHAYSHAHAAGLWQFMPATGRMYDLSVDWWVDQRRDPVSSTRAAARYLSDLHKMFDGDWYLAMASYNGGPGRVSRSVKAAGSRDFWVVAQGSWLHTETENYVPKILAAAIIGKHPERYGFELPAQAASPWQVDPVEVDGAAELTVLAECAGLSLERFRHLNPSLRRWATPPEGTVVNVPAGRRRAFTAALAKVPLAERVSFVRHEVRRGQTLSTIAGKYDVQVAELVRVNHLASADRIYAGMKLVVPMPGADPAAVVAASGQAPPEEPAVSHRVTVKSGDTLSGIASANGVGVGDLMRWNKLSSATIQIGQKLDIRGGQPKAYTVARGDTLSAIASRFKVTVAELMRWNGIRDASLVRVGQSLMLAAPAATWKTVVVAAGDSLGRIAARHSCSVSELQQWNGLSSTVIQPGQRLKIRQGD